MAGMIAGQLSAQGAVGYVDCQRRVASGAVDRRAGVVFAALAVLLGGCSMSKVDPDAEVSVRGTVQTADGSAAPDVRIGLLRVPDPIEVLTQGIVVAGSFGVACMSDDPPPVCRTVQGTKTDSNGGYRFRMTGDDVQGAFGQVSYFDLTAQGPAVGDQLYGPTVSTSFVVQRTELDVPDLRFWVPAKMSAAADGGRFVIRWDGNAPRGRTYTVNLTRDRLAIWDQQVRSGDAVDARVLEDLTAGLHLSASATQPGPDTKFQTTYSSHGVRVTGTAGPPPSRGVRCFAHGAEGAVRLDPCPLTDGAFDRGLAQQKCSARAQSASGPGATCNDWAYLDLGSRKPVGAVFVRSASPGTSLVLETSDDATQWTERARTDLGNFQRHTLSEEPTARYVRLRSTAGGTADTAIAGLTEVSVWPTANP
jgi:hypothetical protein